MDDFIAVLDFGSQYSHLIAKRVRHLGSYTRIFDPSVSKKLLSNAKGIILSGGPASVNSIDIPNFNSEILEMDLPLLGLCYGHQLIAKEFGGKISDTGTGEFGKAVLNWTGKSKLWENVIFPNEVWMSHRDSVIECPPEFLVTGTTDSGSIAAMAHWHRPIYTLQFHPEVTYSAQGMIILENFVNSCDLKSIWSMENLIENTILRLRKEVGEHKVLMFVSGGVDSSVAFALLNKALGKDKILGLYIDNGFMRKNESRLILDLYKNLGYNNVESRDYSSFFLKAVSNQIEPQNKRKKIGSTFIKMREKFLKELNMKETEWMLGQGTLYSDIIESGGSEYAEVIKSHHNRVSEVLDLIRKGKVVEPLKNLYKDEVRKVGVLLGLPDSIIWRQPFPGPGLSINVLCSKDDEDFSHLNKTDLEVSECLKNSNYKGKTLPIRSVGVQGDRRTYTNPVALWDGPKDWDCLERDAMLLTNEIKDVNRVVFQLGSNSSDTDSPFLIHKAYCTIDRLDLLREADHITTQILESKSLMKEIFQLLVILLPISKNGKKDSLVLRPVISEDTMTAKFAQIEWSLIDIIVESLLCLDGIDTIFYDITHKPPATFGWE